MMEAHSAAKLLGDYPSFTTRNESGNGYKLYANIKYADRKNNFKIQELKDSELKGSNWAPTPGRQSKVVAIKTSRGDWLFFGTNSPYREAKTKHDALVLISPTEWRYIARGALDANGTRIDQEVMSHIAEENQQSHIIDFVSPRDRNLVKSALSRLDTYEEAHQFKNGIEAAYEAAFTDTTSLPGHPRLPFCIVKTHASGRPVFQLNHIPLNPPPTGSNGLWIRDEGEYLAFANAMDRARSSQSGRLSFTIDEKGRIRIPLNDKAAGGDNADNPEMQAAYNNYKIIKHTFDTYANFTKGNESDELRSLIRTARQNATMYDDARSSEQYPFVELDTSSPHGNDAMAMLAGFLAHASGDYYRRYQSAMNPTVNEKFVDFRGETTVAFQNLRSRSVKPQDDPSTINQEMYDGLRKNMEGDQITKDLVDISRAMLGDKEYHDIQHLIGSDKPVDFVCSNTFSTKWSLINLRDRTTGKIARGILIPPFPSNRGGEHSIMLNDIQEMYGHQFQVEREVPFNYQSWMLHRDNVLSSKPAMKLNQSALDKLPPLNLSVKMDTIAHAAANTHLGLFTPTGEFELNATKKFEDVAGRKSSKKSGRLTLGSIARMYINRDAAMSEDRRSYLHKIFEPRYDKSEQPPEKDETMLSVHARDTKYSTREDMMEKTTQALTHAMNLADLGGVLASALGSGIVIREQGKDRMFKFDAAGVMYEVDPQHHDDTQYWEPVMPTVFWNDSPYMKVLKGVNALVQHNKPVVEVEDAQGNFAEVRLGSYINGQSFELGNKGKDFRLWHKQLVEKVQQAVGEGEYLENMQALMAFPTMVIKPGQVFDLDSERRRISHMVGLAMKLEPDNLPPGLEKSKYADMFKKMQDGVPMNKVLRLSSDAAQNFRMFQKWVRASYLEDVRPDMTVDHQNVGQLKRDLHNALVERVVEMQRAEGVMSDIAKQFRPTELDTNKEQYEDKKLGLMGKAGQAILDATLRPLHRWIQNAWHDFYEVVKHFVGIATSPVEFAKRTLPAAGEAALMACKVFFQAYFSKVIQTEFKDRSVDIGPNGEKRTISYKKVRDSMSSFLEQSVGLKPYTSQEFTKMHELMKTGAYSAEMGNRYGDLISHVYTPKFRNESMVTQQTNNDPTRVKMIGFQTKNGNPGTTMAVDVPILNPEYLGIRPGMVDAVREFNNGCVIAGNKVDRVPPELQQWYRIYGANFLVDKFRSHNSDAPHSKDAPMMHAFKMKVDNAGHLHVQVQYKMENAFDDHRRAYRQVYHRELTSSSSASSGVGENREERVMIDTLKNKESATHRKMNLVNLLFTGR